MFLLLPIRMEEKENEEGGAGGRGRRKKSSEGVGGWGREEETVMIMPAPIRMITAGHPIPHEQDL